MEGLYNFSQNNMSGARTTNQEHKFFVLYIFFATLVITIYNVFQHPPPPPQKKLSHVFLFF